MNNSLPVKVSARKKFLEKLKKQPETLRNINNVVKNVITFEDLEELFFSNYEHIKSIKTYDLRNKFHDIYIKLTKTVNTFIETNKVYNDKCNECNKQYDTEYEDKKQTGKRISNNNSSNSLNRLTYYYKPRIPYTCSNGLLLLKYENIHNSVNVPYEIALTNQKTQQVYKSIINGKIVYKIDDKTIKKSIYRNDSNAFVSLFVLVLEILIQNLINSLCSINPYLQDNLEVPEITDYYLNTNTPNEYNEVIMIMNYIETKPVSVDKRQICLNIFNILQKEYSIYHNDTHSENILMHLSNNKIVIFDFGKAFFEKLSPSPLGLQSDMTNSTFELWTNKNKYAIFVRPQTDLIETTLFGGKRKSIKYKKIKKNNHKKSIKLNLKKKINTYKNA
jgi:hypothetical protein